MVHTPYPRLPATFNPLGAPHDPARTPDEGLLRSTTAKRLKPGAPGTKRLQERYGDKLLCVRYRIDPNIERREVESVLNQVIEGMDEGAVDEFLFKVDGEKARAGIDCLVADHGIPPSMI